MAGTLCWMQSLLFQQLQVLLTLFSESFSSFPCGTCMLSVSHRVFSLGWSIPPEFRLHSQATRLLDSWPSVDPKHLPIPFQMVGPYYYGNLTLYVSHLSMWTWDRWTVLDLGRVFFRPQLLMTLCFDLSRRFFLGLADLGGQNPGFQAWAFPCSLAVTKGITVVFFSSAY